MRSRPGAGVGTRLSAPCPSRSGLPAVTSSGGRPRSVANRRAGARERPVDSRLPPKPRTHTPRGSSTTGPPACVVSAAGRSPAPRRRVRCAARATQLPPNLLEAESHSRPRRRQSSPPQRAPAAVEASGHGGGAGPARGRGPQGGAACDSPPLRRPRLSGDTTPPLPSSFMAPPRLIHSAPGLLDTCSQIPPPPSPPPPAVAAKMSGPTTDTPAAIQICR